MDFNVHGNPEKTNGWRDDPSRLPQLASDSAPGLSPFIGTPGCRDVIKES